MRDDFTTWRTRREVALLGRVPSETNTNRHRYLEDHPPEFIMLHGQLTKVIVYLGDLLWLCTRNGEEVTVHELESDFQATEGGRVWAAARHRRGACGSELHVG